MITFSCIFLCLGLFFLQKRQGQANSKFISEKYNPDEDSGSGFPIEPSKTRALNAFSHCGQSMHPSVYGSSRNMNSNKEEPTAGPGRVYNSGNPAELRKQRSYMNNKAAQLSRFSSSVANGGGLKLDMSGDSSVSSQWPEDCFGTRYDHLGDDESNQLLKSLHKKDIHPSSKEPSKVKKIQTFCFGIDLSFLDPLLEFSVSINYHQS